MLSLGCERLPTPLKKKKKKKKKDLDHYLHHDLGMLPLLRCFFAHLLILQYPDHHQNLISFYLYYSGPVHKISSQSAHNFLSNVVHRQTNRQTDKLTNATKNITSFAKEVINSYEAQFQTAKCAIRLWGNTNDKIFTYLPEAIYNTQNTTKNTSSSRGSLLQSFGPQRLNTQYCSVPFIDLLPDQCILLQLFDRTN